MSTLTRTIEFTTLECGSCAIQFALTTSMWDRVYASKEFFYCPNGHSIKFTGESSAQKVQKLSGQLDQERTRLEQERRLRLQAERAADYQNRARKAVSTRLRKTKARVGHGVCPCCNRTFAALAKHMETQHPSYAGSAEHE